MVGGGVGKEWGGVVEKEWRPWGRLEGEEGAEERIWESRRGVGVRSGGGNEWVLGGGKEVWGDGG